MRIGNPYLCMNGQVPHKDVIAEQPMYRLHLPIVLTLYRKKYIMDNVQLIKQL